MIEENWLSSKDSPYIIEFANDRFFEILQLERVDFEKNPGIINDMINEDDKPEFIRLNIEANLHKTLFTWEGRIQIKDKPVWIHSESIPRLMENGDIIWTGTLNDISKRKNAEMEIALKNEELLKLNAEKDKFFSIIAHDLKSPFNGIIGLSELLMEKVAERDFERIDFFANTILQSSKRAMDLLKNLLEWAQSSTGRMEYNPEYFEIVDLIYETIFLYEDIAGQKSIVIKKVMSNYVSVFADKSMICTVLRNFISNAIKFTRPGGMVTISSEKKLDEIIVSVKDTGIGISQNCIGDIFHVDHACSTNGTNNEKGTGLGLILCKEFINKHGGKIWVESREKEGSTFYFSLPLKGKRVE